MTKQIATKVQEMNVFMVNFRGTVYGVFSTREKAYLFAELKFGRNAIMCLDVTISSVEVDSIEL